MMKAFIVFITILIASPFVISAPIPSGYQAIGSVPTVSPVSTPVKNLTINPPFANWLEAEFKRSAPVSVIDKHGAKASGAVYRQIGTVSKGPIVRFLVNAAKYGKGKGPYLTAAAFVIPWLLENELEQNEDGAWFERPIEGSVTWVLSKHPVSGSFEQQCAILQLGCEIVATVPPNSPAPTSQIDSACDAHTPTRYKEIGQSAMYGSHSGGICAVGSRTSNITTGHYVRPLSSPTLVPVDITPYVDRLVSSSPQQSLDVSTKDGFIPDGTIKSIEPEISSLLSSPYTLPDGSAVQQTQWNFGPSDKVQISYIPRPDLKPDTEVAPRPDPIPETGTGSGTADPSDPPIGLCDQYPDILACQKLDTDVPDVPIPEDEVIVDLNLNSFSMPAYCPQPRTFEAMGTTYSISYQPFCDFAGMLKGLVIMMAVIGACFIVSKEFG